MPWVNRHGRPLGARQYGTGHRTAWTTCSAVSSITRTVTASAASVQRLGGPSTALEGPVSPRKRVFLLFFARRTYSCWQAIRVVLCEPPYQEALPGLAMPSGSAPAVLGIWRRSAPALTAVGTSAQQLLDPLQVPGSLPFARCRRRTCAVAMRDHPGRRSRRRAPGVRPRTTSIARPRVRDELDTDRRSQDRCDRRSPRSRQVDDRERRRLPDRQTEPALAEHRQAVPDEVVLVGVGDSDVDGFADEQRRAGAEVPTSA